jgi:acetylornithine deacetylase/succinyl-diaminopimelate desuccinylase-like protein
MPAAMKLIRAAMMFAVISLAACGGKVVVDASASGGSGGAGGGVVGEPTACPAQVPDDEQVMGIVGQPCSIVDQVCASNNGCGGCSVTCKGGVWTSTSGALCFSVGGTC